MAIDPNGGESSGGDIIQIDEAYEFSASKFFDFMIEESEKEIHKAEGWFETSLRLSYAPSPFMSRVKVGRSVKIDSLVDFGDEVQNLEESELAQGKQGSHTNTTDSTEI